MMLLTAPCRLHFGLLHVPVPGTTHTPDGHPVRQFGGLGLALEQPSVQVSVDLPDSDLPTVTGNLAGRVNEFLEHDDPMASELAAMTAIITIQAEGPPEHIGYGVGTALGMALGVIVSHTDQVITSVRDLPPRSYFGRGKRSAIGVTAFFRGGFIHDHGKPANSTTLSPCDRYDFPDDWRIVLVTPQVQPRWYGAREQASFARMRSLEQAADTTRRLETLIERAILPALQARDFPQFAASLQEYNRIAGEPFQADQGGIYTSAEVACLIDELIAMGGQGVGQSSWGPTVYAFCPGEAEAQQLASSARDRFSHDTIIRVTRANNTGARLEETA